MRDETAKKERKENQDISALFQARDVVLQRSQEYYIFLIEMTPQSVG